MEIMFGWMAVMGQYLLKTKIVRQLNGFQNEFIPVEDHHFWLAASQIGPVVLLNNQTLNYRIHDEQWRPKKYQEMMNEVRQQSLAITRGPDHITGNRILIARDKYQQAKKYMKEFQADKAQALFKQILAANPKIVGSKIMSPILQKQLTYRSAGSLGLKIANELGRLVKIRL